MIPLHLIEGSTYPTVTAQMQALLAHLKERGDRRCVFLDCYATMTGNMLMGLEEGRFEDEVGLTGCCTTLPVTTLRPWLRMNRGRSSRASSENNGQWSRPG